jgi:hypothetical protein
MMLIAIIAAWLTGEPPPSTLPAAAPSLDVVDAATLVWLVVLVVVTVVMVV